MLFIQTGIAALQLQAFNKLKPAEVILFPEPMPWAVVGGSGVRRVVGGGGAGTSSRLWKYNTILVSIHLVHKVL